MSELQPGMLALVIGADKCVENIGKIVQLNHFVRKGEATPKRIAGLDCWVAYGDDLFTNASIEGLQKPGYGIFKPSDLLPIKPEADPLDVINKEELHA